MLNRLYGWYGKRVVRGVILSLVVLIGVGVYIHNKNTGPALSENSQATLHEVTLRSVKNLGSESRFSVVGTVSALSEANLQTEASGRITAVKVQVGDRVSAGTILASIENSRENAALLQAEGAYESARAASLQGEVSLDEAKVGVRNTYRDTFATADNIVRNLLDEFFSNPGKPISGFRLSGGDATELNDARRTIEKILTEWSNHINTNFEGLTETEMLTSAESAVSFISDFTSELYRIVSLQKTDNGYTSEEIASYKTRLAGARTALAGSLSAISGARRTYEQSALVTSTHTVSQSSAQLKSALGVLRSAQSSYEKTLVRTPISGVINALYLKMGDYAAPGQPAAIVANNGSLEIVTALGEKDVQYVTIGDTVILDNVGTGTVTHIAPAIDPLTGKSEVKINANDSLLLKNGSTVSVTFARDEKTDTRSTNVIVPLAALKFLPSGPVAFGVTEQNILVAYPVTLGPITGDAVLVLDGLTGESEIITDARGRKEGDTVSVIRN